MSTRAFVRKPHWEPEELSPAERSLLDLDWGRGGNREFRREIFRRLPEPLARAVAQEYRSEWNSRGVRHANLMLLDIRDRLTPRTIDLAINYPALRETAEQCAKHCRALSSLCRTPASALAQCARIAGTFAVDPPVVTDSVTESGALWRLWDPTWWLRALRKSQSRIFEGLMRDFGQVHAKAGLYVSSAMLNQFHARRARTRSILESLVAENEIGQQFILQEIVDHSISNPRVKRSELMARIAGFEAVAKQVGHTAEFYTMTAPSRMHARLMSGERNPRYDGTNPRDAHQYMTRLWARIRAKLKRDGLKVYGFRIAEPHHDATPHFHFLLWMESDNAAQVREVLRDYALRSDPDEPGAAQHRFGAIAIDPQQGSAVAYVAKYVAKSIDGAGLPVGEDATSRAERVVASTTTWGQRQFQQIGGPPIGVYRELRRLRSAQSGELEILRDAADRGDFGTYFQAMGGPGARRADLPLRIARSSGGAPGKYGDAVERTVGLQVGNLIVPTRIHRWTIKKGPSREPGDDP